MDTRCTDGITWCAECNGHGLLSQRGQRYRVKRRSPLPPWAVEHAECNGVGMRECGCRPTLGAAERKALAGVLPPSGVRWSTTAEALVEVHAAPPTATRGKGKATGGAKGDATESATAAPTAPAA
ncbi:hypothetical protein BJF78_30090 [Pseudonocardia sp. CNS-139]|nr:hypothetical protein BJF78_30090 [Pseudonocardia sp. CNS-139]